MSWKSHPSLKDIYGDLPRISSLVRKRRVQFTGHVHEPLMNLSHLLFFGGIHHHTGGHGNFPGIISRDTAIPKEDLLTAMTNREYWKGVVNSISAEAAK